MGCSHSCVSQLVMRKDEGHTFCRLQVGERSEAECAAPVVRRVYNSWKHEVDATDLELMEAGQSLPVNQWVHTCMEQEMSKSLSDYLQDPSKLENAIATRRLKYEELLTNADVANSQATTATNSEVVCQAITDSDQSSKTADLLLQLKKGHSLVVAL
ncbi:unnamed protein product [Durusdinium trenchii]|uniref:Uncharacterized protein n=1 Tax=Durusdinium trenchii TaxID=1381693 RepID=A0ABP0SXF8_9DINO